MSTNESNFLNGKSVVIDVDVGTDDAWAILLALSHEKRLNFKVRAITCVQGNSTVDNIGKNVLCVLNTVDRLDVSVFMHDIKHACFNYLN